MMILVLSEELRSDLEALLDEDEAIRDAMAAELVAIMGSFDLLSIGVIKSELSEILSATADDYISTLQELYAEFYRDTIGYSKRVVYPKIGNRLAKGWNWAFSDLYGNVSEDDFDRSKRKVVTSADATSIYASRNIITDSLYRDGKKHRLAWQRLSFGDSCDFCTGLSSKGPVFISNESANSFRGFHHHCRCIVVPVSVFV